jgi:hypothetical protein
MLISSRFGVIALIAAMAFAIPLTGNAAEKGVQKLSLREAMQAALLNNRQLQIERINPELARMDLKSAYGYYDPLLAGAVRHEHVTDEKRSREGKRRNSI